MDPSRDVADHPLIRCGEGPPIRPARPGRSAKGQRLLAVRHIVGCKTPWRYSAKALESAKEVPVMSELSKRSTIYFEPEIHHALRVMAASTHQSVSEFVNEAVRMALQEDQQDLSVFAERSTEPTMSYEELLDDLKSHGKLRASVQEVSCQGSSQYSEKRY